MDNNVKIQNIMRTLLTVLILITIPLELWACSCLQISPINLSAETADQIIIGERITESPFSNSIEIVVTKVVFGNSALLGQTILIWDDNLGCSSVPRGEFSSPILMVLNYIKKEDLSFFISRSTEFTKITNETGLNNLIQIAKSQENYLLPPCSDSYLKLEKFNRVEFGKYRRGKKRSGKLIIKRHTLSKNELINYFMKIKNP